MAKSYSVSDGRVLITLHALQGGRFGITRPDDPALICEAGSIEEAFVMARDAGKTLAKSRARELADSKRPRRTA